MKAGEIINALPTLAEIMKTQGGDSQQGEFR
jgi:hypothetical protein